MPSFSEIRARYHGDDAGPYYLIHSGGIVHALCLREDLNPRIGCAPAEVWVGAEEHVASWGKTLAEDSGALPVFVAKEKGAEYMDQGVHHVIGSTTDPKEIAARESQPGIGKLSRIVFLKKV
jgi:hypothetical protein